MGNLVIEGGQIGQETPAYKYLCWLGCFRVLHPFRQEHCDKEQSKNTFEWCSFFLHMFILQMLGVSIGSTFQCLISFLGGQGKEEVEAISYPQILQYWLTKKKIK